MRLLHRFSSKRTSVWIFLFCATFLFSISSAHAQVVSSDGNTSQTATVTPESGQTESSESPTPSQPIADTLLDAITIGRTFLADYLHPNGKVAPAFSKNSYVFAVWNSDTKTVSVYPATKDASHFVLPNNSPFQIVYKPSAGALSPYITNPSQFAIVGLLFPEAKIIKIKKNQTKTEYQPSMSVPLSAQFFTPQIYAVGSDYLSDSIGKAYADLDKRNIRSRAFPGKLVSAVIDPYLVKAIIISEHTSNKGLVGNAEGTMETLLVRLAIEGGSTFHASVSPKGATGLVQFIPSTYSITTKNHPEYGLIADFAAGMNNHFNAIKAEVALLDAILATLPSSAREAFNNNDVQRVSALLAASYNGGSLRVERALAVWGDAWTQSHASAVAALKSKAASLKSQVTSLKSKVKKASGKNKTKLQSQLSVAQKKYASANAELARVDQGTLRSETVNYLIKIQKAYDIFSSGMYATPHAPSGALPTIAQVLPPSNAADVSSNIVAASTINQ